MVNNQSTNYINCIRIKVCASLWVQAKYLNLKHIYAVFPPNQDPTYIC